MENRNAILQISISHVIKSTFLIGRKYFLNFIAQGDYYIIETKLLPLAAPFLKNIETIDCCKFVKACVTMIKVSKENLLEFL